MKNLKSVSTIMFSAVAVALAGILGWNSLYNFHLKKEAEYAKKHAFPITKSMVQSNLDFLENILEDYKNSAVNPDQGKYPKSLEELRDFMVKKGYRGGAFMATLDDPYTKHQGKFNLLTYQPSADRTSYDIYSVGPNKIDDIGAGDDISLEEIITKREIVKDDLKIIAKLLEYYKNSPENPNRGKYPEKLEEATNFIQEKYGISLVDPFNVNKKTFNYKALDDRKRFLLYSVGPNILNDKGENYGDSDDIKYESNS